MTIEKEKRKSISKFKPNFARGAWARGSVTNKKALGLIREGPRCWLLFIHRKRWIGQLGGVDSESMVLGFEGTTRGKELSRVFNNKSLSLFNLSQFSLPLWNISHRSLRFRTEGSGDDPKWPLTPPFKPPQHPLSQSCINLFLNSNSSPNGTKTIKNPNNWNQS